MDRSAEINIEAVLAQFQAPLHRYILRHVRDEQVTADLLQDVFVKIYQRLDTVRDVERLEGWLYRVARNTVYDYYRTSHPQVELNDNLPAAESAEADEELQLRLQQVVRYMVTNLPPDYARALQLTDFEGLSQQQLAQQLGISVSGAKSRVQRARKMLRAALLACCHFELDRRGRVIDYYPHRCGCSTECAC